MKLISASAAKQKGLPRYFTGKKCKRGHLTERRVVGGACVKCSLLAVEKYNAT
ncbi:MAG: hypothetical protein JWO19_5973 [Bryobacterales bacterium]|nr:hypothetical protein [Bryobacterales bacterium]